VSDGFEYLDGKEINGENIVFRKIIGFPYPLITANKFQMVKIFIEELK